MSFAPHPKPPAERPASSIESLRDPAIRNLAIGLAAFLVTAVVLTMAIFLSWSHALVGLVVAVLALGILWLLWRLGLHLQPYGFFLSLSLVCLVAATIPMTYGMIHFIRTHQPPVAALPPATAVSSPARASTPEAASGVPLLREKYPPPAFDPTQDAHVELLRDADVQVAGESYHIRAGETFPLLEQVGADLLVRAGSEAVPLSTKVARVIAADGAVAPGTATAAKAETPEEQAARAARLKGAQAQALRMYPALGIKDTRENKAFIAAYEQMKETSPQALDDPEWPLHLAKALAESQGWKRESP